MVELDGIPGELTSNGHTWKKHVYHNGHSHQWYRRMTDEEVREHTDGRLNGFDDFDGFLTWNIADYPVYMIELNHTPTDNSDAPEWKVTANRTYFGPPRPGMIEGLGTEYTVTTDSKEEAVQTVQEWVDELS